MSAKKSFKSKYIYTEKRIYSEYTDFGKLVDLDGAIKELLFLIELLGKRMDKIEKNIYHKESKDGC